MLGQTEAQAETGILKQMEIIFLNFDTDPF